MKVTEINHPLAASLLCELRDQNTSQPDFSRALGTLGQVLFLEALRNDAPMIGRRLSTPLAEYDGTAIDESRVVLTAILRAGLGFLFKIRELVPNAACGMIAAARDETTSKPEIFWTNMPPIDADSHIFVCEPMLATGGTAVAAIRKMSKSGIPGTKNNETKNNETKNHGVKNNGAKVDTGNARVVILSAIAAPEALAKLKAETAGNIEVYVAAVDRGLNSDNFILPGLGDAGDRLFYQKP